MCVCVCVFGSGVASSSAATMGVAHGSRLPIYAYVCVSVFIYVHVCVCVCFCTRGRLVIRCHNGGRPQKQVADLCLGACVSVVINVHVCVHVSVQHPVLEVLTATSSPCCDCFLHIAAIVARSLLPDRIVAVTPARSQHAAATKYHDPALWHQWNSYDDHRPTAPARPCV